MNQSGNQPTAGVTRPKPLVCVKNLHFTRGSRKIFDGVDINIERGKITAIMGPSGTGKTTLAQAHRRAAQAGFRNHHRGWTGRKQLSRDRLFGLRRRMGMLFQSGALLTDLDVFENVAFPVREHTNLTESMIRNLVLMKLESVGLRGARDLFPRELSGGMARRAALARAIVLDPMMVMYDEPFSGQDPISMGVLVQLIDRLDQALQLTSIIVSHDVPETASIADYIYVLSGGKVVGEGTPEELGKSDSEWVTQFMRGLADGPVPFHYPGPAYADDLISGPRP